MQKPLSILDQMFEIALKTKNVTAAKFAVEWAEFEKEFKQKEKDNEQCHSVSI